MSKIHVIEFQKRGLPHAHIAVKMRREPKTGRDTDEVICAELPRDDPARLAKVLEHHIHNHYQARCYKTQYQKDTKTCKYTYPKPIVPETYTDDAGYCHYRRRSVEDAYVVPYNSELLDIFDCHINVEQSATVLLIMYLYKYFYKGVDYASGKLSIASDEIAQFICGRYLSASEAIWRFFEFDLTRREPSVDRYPVHTENANFVVYDEDNDTSKNRAKDSISALERYFLRPIDAKFDQVKYTDYYEQFMVTNRPSKSSMLGEHWTDKVPPPRGSTVYHRSTVHVARMDTKKPAMGEVWYLRLILKHKAGRSYAEVRTVDNVVYNTYSETARAMSLLENSSEAHICLDEAVKTLMCDPRELRSLYVILVNEGAPAKELFDIHRDYMTKDFLLKAGMTATAAADAVLLDLARRFESCGRALADYGLPEPLNYRSETDKENFKFNHNECDKRFQEAHAKFTAEQEVFYQNMRQYLDSGSGRSTYLDGAAGRGKTFLLTALVDYVRSTRRIALCCASTGFVAVMYPGGRTAHNLFKISVKTDPYDLSPVECDVPYCSERADLLRSAVLIIWDEFVMSNKENIEAVDRMLRRIRKRPDEPFGGVLFIGAGDFRQIPPVVQYGTKEETVSASVRFSHLWSEFTIFTLKTPVRQLADPLFARFLDDIGIDACVKDQDGYTILRDIQATTSLKEYTEFVYPLLAEGVASTSNQGLQTLRNAVVDQMNADIADMLKGQYISLYSHDQLDTSNEAGNFFSTELNEDFFHSLKPANIPPHELRLKEGLECFIVRNLSPEDGLLNNTPIRIVSLSRNLVKAQLLHHPNRFLIPRIQFAIELRKKSLRVIRRQFPIRCAYVKTINRAQGSTMDRTAIDLREDPFAHGQLLVGLSRVRSRSTLLILTTADKMTEEGFAKTKNIVYQELLL